MGNNTLFNSISVPLAQSSVSILQLMHTPNTGNQSKINTINAEDYLDQLTHFFYFVDSQKDKVLGVITKKNNKFVRFRYRIANNQNVNKKEEQVQAEQVVDKNVNKKEEQVQEEQVVDKNKDKKEEQVQGEHVVDKKKDNEIEQEHIVDYFVETIIQVMKVGEFKKQINLNEFICEQQAKRPEELIQVYIGDQQPLKHSQDQELKHNDKETNYTICYQSSLDSNHVLFEKSDKQNYYSFNFSYKKAQKVDHQKIITTKGIKLKNPLKDCKAIEKLCLSCKTVDEFLRTQKV